MNIEDKIKKSLRVLVVDDELELLSIYQENLEEAGFEVTCCGDLDSAVKALRQNTFDAIVIDWVFGHERADRVLVDPGLREFIPKKVIVISSHRGVGGFETLKNLKYLYLEKPILMGRLIESINTMEPKSR